MLKLSMVLAPLALAGLPQPALAQDATPAAAVAGPIDPARLALARTTVDAVFPAGTYARIMNRSLNAVVTPMIDGMGQIPLRDFAGLGGTSKEQLAKMGPGTLRQIMAIIDPAYEERSHRMVTAMFRELGAMMSTFEPTMRDALAHAYARRFTAAQLGDLNAFFASPSGKAYAAEAMTIYSDPDVATAMQAFMPTLTKQMPELVRKAQADSADLPKPRQFQDLTPAERKRLAELVGVTESALESNSAK